MITEVFINTCYSVVFNNSSIRKDKTLFRDILSIMSFYEKRKKLDVPVAIKTKVDCLVKICQMRLEDKTEDNIIDSLALSEKYNDIVDFIEAKREIDVNDVVLSDNIKQIRLRKKFNSLMKNYDELSNFIDTIKEGTFDCIDDVIEDYDGIVKGMYTNLMEASRGETIEASESLDMVKDDYGPVVELITKKYERKNTTPTGFPMFDNQIFNGGFEPSRLYVIGGGSGAGKSTLLNNFIIKSATRQLDLFQIVEDQKAGNSKKVYVYITLENTIEESLMRFYLCMFDKTAAEMIADISSFHNLEDGVKFIRDKIVSELDKTNSTIIMKYFKPTTISSVDIMMVLDDVISEYGKDSIKGLYIDYLDLLKTDIKYDALRLEQGHTTLSLKTMAVVYSIPVITATQLNRAVYSVNEARDLTLSQMGESMKKVDHADVVLLLAKDAIDEMLVHMKVGKNRSGRANMSIDFRVNFTKYQFLNGMFVSNEKHDRISKTIKSAEVNIETFKDLGNGF